jgi:hypothetical protein
MPKKRPDATALSKRTDRRSSAPTAPEEPSSLQVIGNYQFRYRDLIDLMQASTTTPEYPGRLGKLPTLGPQLLNPKSAAHSALTLLAQSDGDNCELLSKWEQYLRERKTELEWYWDSKKLLYEHYGIDITAPDADAKLIWALAEAHVPAFQFKRALREYYARRSKKPPKLDWKGSVFLFIHEQLKDESKERLLSRPEEELKRQTEEQLKAYKLAERTVRGLRAQMRSALAKYLDGRANDFQKQFLELAWPWI